MMNEIIIYEYQLKAIAEALRLTANHHNCRSKKTCFDRQVAQAEQFAKNALEGNKDKEVKYV